MALTAWKAGRVRKTDVIVTKNHLSVEEGDYLNNMVAALLEFADLRTRQRKQLLMADWRQYVDNFIQFNESPCSRASGIRATNP